MRKPRKPSKRAIKRAMALPGMESHIRRLKASWRNPAPSDEILERWVRCRVLDMIRVELHKVKSTRQLIDMYGDLVGEDI